MSLLPIFPLGGAFADVGDDDTAFGGGRSPRLRGQHGRGRPRPGRPGGRPGLGPVVVGGAAPVRAARRAATSTSWPSDEEDRVRARLRAGEVRAPGADQGRSTTPGTSSTATRTSPPRRPAMNTVLVTGATGNIGSALVRELLGATPRCGRSSVIRCGRARCSATAWSSRQVTSPTRRRSTPRSTGGVAGEEVCRWPAAPGRIPVSARLALGWARS